MVSPDGGLLTITFSAETDRAGLGGVFNCSAVFMSADALALGESDAPSTAICYWRDSLSLVARFGPTATVSIEDSLTLRSGVIGARADPTVKLNDPEMVVLWVSGPDVASPPVPVIDGTSRVGWCDDFALDGSSSYGGAGRPFVGGYQWALVRPEDNSTDIMQSLVKYLATQRDVVVSLDGPALELNTTRTYNFSLTLENWLGQRTTAFYGVEIVPTDQVVVRIDGVTPAVHRDTALSLRGVVDPPCVCKRDQSLPVCDGTTHFSYAWVRTGGPTFPLDLDTRTSSSLYIPAGSLRGGAAYQFTLTATNADLLFYVGQATATVSVIEQPLQAVIHSGTRYVSRFAPIELDGSASFDPNGGGALRYSWSCRWAGSVGLHYGDSCPASRYLDTADFREANVMLPASALPPGDWVFTLTVTSQDRARNATAQQLVTVAWKDTPSVLVRLAQAGGAHMLGYDDLPSTMPLRFEATVSSALGRAVGQLGWVLVDGDVELNASGIVQPSPYEPTALTFNPGVLTPGTWYRLRFNALYEDDVLQAPDWSLTAGVPWAASIPTDVGWTELNFSIGAFPWGGSCSLEPQEGRNITHATLASLMCYGFDAPSGVESAPLLFHFYVRHSGDPLGGLFPLSSHTSVSDGRFQTYLPSTGPNATIDVYAKVFDRSGSPAYPPGAEGMRLIPVASSVLVQGASAPAVEFNEGLTHEFMLRGRVDLVPTLLYSVLHDLNGNATSTTRDPLADPEEHDLRAAIFDELSNELAFEKSQDATTVQSQLLYFVSGGRRPSPSASASPTPSASPSWYPSPSASPPSASGSPMPLKRSRSAGRTVPSLDLGVEMMAYLDRLTLGTLQPDDRTYVASAASNILEFFKAYALNQTRFAELLVHQLIVDLAADQAAAMPLGSAASWETDNIKVAISKYPGDVLPASMAVGGVVVTLPTEDIAAGVGSAEVEVYLCVYSIDPMPLVVNGTLRTTLAAPVVLVVLRSGGEELSLPSLQRGNFTVHYPLVLSENPSYLPVESVIGHYNASCSSWTNAMWTTSCWPLGAEHQTRVVVSANGTTCRCSGLLSGAPLSVVATGGAPTPGPTPVGASGAGSSEDTTRWIMLAILVPLACIAVLLLAYTRFYEKKAEPQESDYEIPLVPPPPPEPEPEEQGQFDTRDRGVRDVVFEDEPPEELKLPQDSDAVPTIALNRPKFVNGRIVFEGHSPSRSRSHSRRSDTRSRSPSRSDSRSRSTRSRSMTRSRSSTGQRYDSRSGSGSSRTRSQTFTRTTTDVSRDERSGEDFSSEEERGALVRTSKDQEREQQMRQQKEEEEARRREQEQENRRRVEQEEARQIQEKEQEEQARKRREEEEEEESKKKPEKKPETPPKVSDEDSEEEEEDTYSSDKKQASEIEEEEEDEVEDEDSARSRSSRSRSASRSRSRSRSRSPSRSQSYGSEGERDNEESRSHSGSSEEEEDSMGSDVENP